MHAASQRWQELVAHPLAGLAVHALLVNYALGLAVVVALDQRLANIRFAIVFICSVVDIVVRSVPMCIIVSIGKLVVDIRVVVVVAGARPDLLGQQARLAVGIAAVAYLANLQGAKYVTFKCNHIEDARRDKWPASSLRRVAATSRTRHHLSPGSLMLVAWHSSEKNVAHGCAGLRRWAYAASAPCWSSCTTRSWGARRT